MNARTGADIPAMKCPCVLFHARSVLVCSCASARFGSRRHVHQFDCCLPQQGDFIRSRPASRVSFCAAAPSSKRSIDVPKHADMFGLAREGGFVLDPSRLATCAFCWPTWRPRETREVLNCPKLVIRWLRGVPHEVQPFAVVGGGHSAPARCRRGRVPWLGPSHVDHRA